MQSVAEGAGFVAAVDGVGQRQLGFDPLEEFGRSELLRRLGRAVVEDADHHDGVGMDVQAQFEGGDFFARGLIRANVGGMEFWFSHIVGGCSAWGAHPPTLMSSLPRGEGARSRRLNQVRFHPRSRRHWTRQAK